MKKVFILITGLFIWQTAFSQTDSIHHKSFSIGLKTDATFEPYHSHYNGNFTIYNIANFSDAMLSLDPALVLNFKRNSLSIGPKIFFAHSSFPGINEKWNGFRIDYQYSFNLSPSWNLFLFYEFAFAHHKYAWIECPCYDGPGYPMLTVSKREFVNHEIGFGGSGKLSKNFYINFSYGSGINSTHRWGSKTNMDSNIELRKWNNGNLIDIERLTGLFRTGLSYDFK